MKNQSRAQLRPVFQRNGILALCLVLFTLVLGLSASAQESGITTFNVPGAGTHASQGTFAYGINQSGEIVGFYLDANYVYHGFLRASNGALTTFEAPGAGAVHGTYQGTYALSINSQGTITGFYLDAKSKYHGYLRSSNGNFTTFDAPGAGTLAHQGTFAYGINTQGAITGFYLDVNYVYHGLVRSSNGNFTTFEAPGAGSGDDEGTLSALFSSSNQSGAIAGFYLGSKHVYHGFLRTSSGKFTVFEAPGADTSAGSYHGTVPGSINDEGSITGYYLHANNVNYGFVRSADGTFTTFAAPGAGGASGQGTIADSLNDEGSITGYYLDASDVNHGFLRSAEGALTTFDVSGAGNGSGQGTVPEGNNSAGVVTGYYTDANNVNHGFLLIP